MKAQRYRHSIVWIAALAILWGVLASSFIAARGASTGQSWVEVCTSTGSKLVALSTLDVPHDDDSEMAGHAGDHCPYCRLEQDLPAIPHASAETLLADAFVHEVPAAFERHRPHHEAVWPAHRSRAPPDIS